MTAFLFDVRDVSGAYCKLAKCLHTLACVFPFRSSAKCTYRQIISGFLKPPVRLHTFLASSFVEYCGRVTATQGMNSEIINPIDLTRLFSSFLDPGHHQFVQISLFLLNVYSPVPRFFCRHLGLGQFSWIVSVCMSHTVCGYLCSLWKMIFNPKLQYIVGIVLGCCGEIQVGPFDFVQRFSIRYESK